MTAKEHYKAWYKKNKERKIKQVREWQLNNKDKLKRYSKTWNDKNKEYYRQCYLDRKLKNEHTDNNIKK